MRLGGVTWVSGNFVNIGDAQKTGRFIGILVREEALVKEWFTLNDYAGMTGTQKKGRAGYPVASAFPFHQENRNTMDFKNNQSHRAVFVD
jgi:hypothetical protein